MDHDLPPQVERLPWDAPRLTQLDLDGTLLGQNTGGDGIISTAAAS
jgi:hypothetical protein